MERKLEVQSIKVKAKINLTADDWQLYNLPGRDAAARRINRAIERKLAKGEINSLYEALAPCSKWGATDTEGFMAIAWILERMGFDDDKFI